MNLNGYKIWIIWCDRCEYIEAGRTKQAISHCRHTCVYADGSPSGKTKVERVELVSKTR